MSRTPTRLIRLLVATSVIPLAAWAAYMLARYIDGEPDRIDNNGSGLGALIVVGSVFAASRIASDQEWSERAAISLGLSAAFFLLSWVQFGDPSSSVDAAPHVIWYAASVVVFAPVVVILAVAHWVWSIIQLRRDLA